MQTDTHRSRHSACGPSDRLHIMCCTSHAAKQIKINLNISVTDFVALTATIAESVKHRSGVRPSVCTVMAKSTHGKPALCIAF